MKRKDRSLTRRFFGTFGALTLLGTCGYIFFAGINMYAGAIIAVAILSIATPVVGDGGSIFEVLAGILEAFVEGIASIFEVIANIFNF